MDESFKEVLQHFVFPRPTSEDIIKILIFLLVFVALVFGTVLVHSYLQRRKERTRLLRAAKKHNLSKEENYLLDSLAKSNKKVDPGQAFGSIREFHRLFGPMMHELAGKAEVDQQAREKLEGIFALRQKLFGEISYHFGAVKSTIQLKIGQKITLEYTRNGQKQTASSVVLDVDAAAITVANPTEEGKFIRFAKGEQFKVAFYRVNDGYYEFQTNALQNVEQGSNQFLFLAHAHELKRMQSRMFYRMPTRIPLKFRRFAWDENLESRYRLEKEEIEGQKEGYILDIGGGGMMVTTEEELSRNDLLIFDLQLNPEHVIRNLLGKVVRIEKQLAGEKNNINIQFLNIKPAEQDLIARLVQQQKIKSEDGI